MPQQGQVINLISSSTSKVAFFYKVHYFLWFSSLSGVLPYYVVFIRTYTSASAAWIGVLFSLLPFVAFFTNPIFCSLADRSSNPLKYLLLFIGLTWFGYGSLLILPSIERPLFSWSFSAIALLIAYPSMATVTSLTDSIVMILVTSLSDRSDSEPKSDSKSPIITFGHIRVWGTIGYGFFGFLSGPINSVSFNNVYLQLGFIMFLIICLVDFAMVIIIIYQRKRSSSSSCLDKSEGQTDERKWTKINKTETNNKFKSRNNDLQRHQEKQPFLPSSSPVNDNNQVNNLNCGNNQQLITQKSGKQSTNHWKSFATLFINHPTIIQHTIVLIGQGVLMSCHWSFFYWFLESVSGPDTVLMGLALFIGCFCGELTFFYFGASIVNSIGPINSFNISLIAFTVQYFCYAFLIVPGHQYLVCLTEILQGPTFGLFYTAMTHIGQSFADKHTTVNQGNGNNGDGDGDGHPNEAKIHSTLQGFLSGALEGLGLGLGSLGAGFIIDHYSVQVMWISAGTLALILLAFNLSLQLIVKLSLIYRSKQ